MKFRDLTANEIEVRVSRVTNAGVELLLFKDSRCDMRILDETVGAENWQNEFYEQKGTLFCKGGTLHRLRPWANVGLEVECRGTVQHRGPKG